jgi:hypothetical protein
VTPAAAVSRPAHFLGSDDPASFVAVQEDGQPEGEEEHDGVHDAQDPRGLEHGAVLVQVERPLGPAVPAIVTERAQVDVDGAEGEVGAVGVVDAAELVDAGDEGAHEAQVDEGDEEGRAAGRAEADERHEGPCEGQHRDDEEDEDEGGCQLVVLVEAVNEPCLRCAVVSVLVMPWARRDGRRNSPACQRWGSRSRSQRFSRRRRGDLRAC